MPAKPHPKRDQILELSIDGLKPREIAEELGIQQKEAAGVVYYARKSGHIPRTRGRKGLRYLMDKSYGELKFGRLGSLTTDLTVEQQEWLFEECMKLKTGTIMEYLTELIRDEFEEAKGKDHD